MNDELRDELHRTMESLRGTVIDGRTIGLIPKWVTSAFADALLPVVERRIAQARAETAEQIAATLASVPDEIYPEDVFGTITVEQSRRASELLKAEGLGTVDRFSARAMRIAYRQAARIARQHAEGVGSDDE